MVNKEDSMPSIYKLEISYNHDKDHIEVNEIIAAEQLAWQVWKK